MLPPLHPSLVLDDRRASHLSRVAAALTAGVRNGSSPSTWMTTLGPLGVSQVHWGSCRVVVVVGPPTPGSWVVKVTVRPESRANASELERYAAGMAEPDPDDVAYARTRLVPVYALSGGAVCAPWALPLSEREYADVSARGDAAARRLNIPDAHYGNWCWMPSASGEGHHLALLDYGYDLTTPWAPYQWPQGEQTAPADLRRAWLRRMAA